jgi:hypothetical protein
VGKNSFEYSLIRGFEKMESKLVGNEKFEQ